MPISVPSPSRHQIGRPWITCLILTLSLLFLLRAIAFASRFGAIEHDSGWYLGVARNLAQRGIYASYTNTIAAEAEGAHPSLHGRFSVQDAQGYSYFPAGVTAGPGYVIPQAFLLRLFGFGWWQYRLWPLLTFVGLLILLFSLAYRLGGLLSLAVFGVWLWLTPQLYLIFAYEAFSEPTALFYLVGSLFLLVGIRHQHPRAAFLLSGVLFGFAVATKLLIAVTVPAVLPALLWPVKGSASTPAARLRLWVFWIVGCLAPVALFELYRYQSLTGRFGIQAWEAINQDLLLHARQRGAPGAEGLLSLPALAKRLTLWQDLGIRPPLLPWLTLLISPLGLRGERSSAVKLIFVTLLVAGSANLAWYLLFSQTGWTRHAWFGLVIGMLLLSVAATRIFMSLSQNLRLTTALFLALLLPWFVRNAKLEARFFLDQARLVSWEAGRYARGVQGLPTNAVFSLEDQRQLVAFFSENVRPADRVYYLGWFLVAEIPPLVDKVFLSLDRYLALGQINPDGGTSYLIHGPFQKGPLSLVGQDYAQQKSAVLCQAIVFANPSYSLCSLRQGISYTNLAYD